MFSLISLSPLLLVLVLVLVLVDVDGFNTASRQRFNRTARSFGGSLLVLLVVVLLLGIVLESELEASWESAETDSDSDSDSGVVGESEDHRRKVSETIIPGMRAALGDEFFVVASGE